MRHGHRPRLQVRVVLEGSELTVLCAASRMAGTVPPPARHGVTSTGTGSSM